MEHGASVIEIQRLLEDIVALAILVIASPVRKAPLSEIERGILK